MTIRKAVTPILRSDTHATIPTAGQACPVTIVTHGRTLVPSIVTEDATIALILLPAQTDLHSIVITGEPGWMVTGAHLH